MILNLRKWMLMVLFACLALAVQAQKNAKYHTVEEGQTLYSIARQYHITANELMKLNPDMGDLIRPGDKVRIPDNATVQTVAAGPGAQFVGGNSGQSAQQPGTSRCKQMYQIKKKDTLYRISQDFGLSVQELLDANPGLTSEGKLKKGDWLCIPYSKAEMQSAREKEEAQRAAALAASKKKTKSHLNVAIILPLKENTDRGGKMVEFYQGFLMAADSVRKQGTSVDIYAYHSGSGVADLNQVLAKEELKHMDVIFGPLDGVQANVLNNFSLQNKVRLVMPFGSTNTYGSTNPYAYIASPQQDDVNRGGAEMAIKQFSNYNIVVVSSGMPDSRATSFITQLTARNIYVKHLELDGDDITFSTMLTPSRNNLIVLNSSSQNVLQKATKKLRAVSKQHPEYKISLLGYPDWVAYQNSIVQDFHALDTYTFSHYFRNPNDARTQHFEQRFKANFHHELIKTLPRYGIMGLDLGYYFMNGLSKLGDYFDERQQTLNYNPLQNFYSFTRMGQNKAFVNTCVRFIHYNPSGTITIQK